MDYRPSSTDSAASFLAVALKQVKLHSTFFSNFTSMVVAYLNAPLLLSYAVCLNVHFNSPRR